MKKCIYLILVLAATLTSCEDVIELDLPTATPRLVIEASIDWQKGTTGNEQRIKITKTTDFYSTTVEAVNGADVSVMGNGQTFNFIQDATGDYVCGNFDPALNETYVLTVLYNNEVYTASETLIPTPTLENVIQDNDGGFTGEDIELKFTFQDDGTTDNFYMFKFTSPINPLPNYDVVDDDFFQGNTMFAFYSDEDLEANMEIECTLYGVSETYYNYMNILLGIAGTNGGSPFQTPPGEVRGNIVNTTNETNYPYGFFRLSEVDTKSYTVE